MENFKIFSVIHHRIICPGKQPKQNVDVIVSESRVMSLLQQLQRANTAVYYAANNKRTIHHKATKVIQQSSNKTIATFHQNINAIIK